VSLDELARRVWHHAPDSVRGWLRAVRAADRTTPGAVFANRVLRRILPQSLRRKLTGGWPIDRPTFVERLIASPYVSYRLLKRADTQRALRQTLYQRFLDSYSVNAQLGSQVTVGIPDASSFVRAALTDPTIRNAFGYQDLVEIVTFADERAAIQLVSRPECLKQLLDDPVVFAAFRRCALEEGPAKYATRIAQEISGRADYRRSIFDRLGQGGDFTIAKCGKSTVIVSLRDFGVAKELFSSQEFELGAFQRYLSLRNGRQLEYFIDVGANLGTHTLYALQDAGFAQAVSVEPDPRNLPLLRANLALNGVDGRARVLPAAVAADEGSIDLYQSAINWADNRTFPVAEEGWTRVKVATISLDRIVRDSGFDHAGLTVWVDVQGAERRVLEGAPETLASSADLVIEFWPYELQRTGELDKLVGVLETVDRRLVRLDHGTSIDAASIAKVAQDLLRQGPGGYIDIALLPASSR